MLGIIFLLETNGLDEPSKNDVFLTDPWAVVKCCPFDFAPHMLIQPGHATQARLTTGHNQECRCKRSDA